MSGEMLERRVVTADEILMGLEYILGRRVMQALQDKLNYEYFGIEDIAEIIETRPDIFERTMRETLGSAGPALIRRARALNVKG
jgi:hypothetical protein